MASKDYYKILDVGHTASSAEIKKSYRRLAMKYHPDRNQGDTMAGEVFREITEAYSVLADPNLRRGYDNQGTRRDEVRVVSKADVLKKITSLQQKAKVADRFRVNRDAVLYSILQILSPGQLGLLEKDSSPQETTKVLGQLLECCELLSFTQLQKVSPYLYKLADQDSNARETINQFLQKSKSNSTWEKYKVLVAVILAVILCALIFWLS